MAVTQELVAKFKADVTDFNRKIDNVQRQLDQTAKKTKNVQSISAKASTAITGHYKAIGLAVGTAAVAVGAFSIKVGSDMQQAQKRIEAMLGTAKDAEFVIKSLREAGQETGASVIGLANSFGKLATFVNNGTLSLQESIKISKGLSSTALALGAGTEQLNQVMFGLSQALGSGTVRAEEFNQVTEPLPGIINRMEEAAGLATGELRKMINSGEVSSQMFKDLLIPAVQSFSKEAEKMSQTLKAQAGILTNTLSSIGEDIFDYLESPLASATKVLNEFLQTLLSAERASAPEVQRRLNDIIGRKQDLMSQGFSGRGGASRRAEFNQLSSEESDLISELQSRVASSNAPSKSGGGSVGVISSSGAKGKSLKSGKRSSGGFGTDPIETLKQQMDALRAITIEAGEETKSLADIMKESSADAATAIEQNFIAMASGSSSSFKDMARSMVQDLNRIIMRALVMRAVSGLVNQFAAPTAHTASVSGTFLEGGAGSAGAFGMSGLGGASFTGISGARANGGQVMAGRSYLVGEKGAEVLTMGSSGGFVTSNAQSGSMISNNGMTVNIDARGASAGVENKIRQVMSDMQGLKKQVPNIAVAAVREQNARKPDFLR